MLRFFVSVSLTPVAGDTQRIFDNLTEFLKIIATNNRQHEG
jgi:hypothetical protein